MEVIAFILIVVLALLSGKGKKKPNQAARPGAAQPAAKPAAQPVSQLTHQQRQERMNELRQRRQARQAQPAQPTVVTPEQTAAQDFDASLTELRDLLSLANAALAEGSPVDGEGCVGGSLAHTHEEGESREEHARHIAAMEARDAEEAAAFSPRRAVSAAEMRRAVVMSEVLGRPKALSRGR